MIPGKGSGTAHVSFTPPTLSESVCVSRCVGLALGFMSLDSEVKSTNQHQAVNSEIYSEWYKCETVLCVCRLLPAFQAKLRELRVWMWSPSEWIYWLLFSLQRKQLHSILFMSSEPMHPAPFMFSKLNWSNSSSEVV